MSEQQPFDKTGIHPDDCNCGGVMCEEDKRDKLLPNYPQSVKSCCDECAEADKQEAEIQRWIGPLQVPELQWLRSFEQKLQRLRAENADMQITTIVINDLRVDVNRRIIEVLEREQ